MNGPVHETCLEVNMLAQLGASDRVIQPTGWLVCLANR